jgi:uncharacterized protein (TIGR03435 family)
MNVISSTPLLTPVLDHLWQSTAFAGVMALAAFALRKNRAAVRFWLWLAASMKFLVPFALFMELGMFVRKQPALATTSGFERWPAIQDAGQAVFTPVSTIVTASAPARSQSEIWLTIAVVVWACGFLFVAFRWIKQWQVVRALVLSAKPIDVGLPIATVSAPVRLEPGVFGIFRPVLFLPEGISARLAPEQMQALFAHEICHIRRRDNLWAAVHVLVEAIFWFHPLVWWLGAQMVAEREGACDEAVMQSGVEAEAYAASVLDVCRIYMASPTPAVAGITGADLKKRVLTIAGQSFGRSLSPAKKLALSVVGVAALGSPIVLGLALGQANSAADAGYVPTLTFDVASIKLGDSVPSVVMNRNPAHSATFDGTNLTLGGLVADAYGLGPGQLVGGPPWVDATRFTVQAKSDSSIDDVLKKLSNSQARLEKERMLQALLADRFQLKAHWETKQLAIYALVVAKNGPKFHATEAPPASPNPAGSSSNPELSTRETCTPNPDSCKVIAVSQSMEFLRRIVSDIVQTPVLDKTGLSGNYDFTLQWNPRPLSTTAADPTQTPSIFTMLQEQLGLKLESTRGPVEVLVIDSAEKPSEN